MEYLTLKDIALINMGQSPDSKTYNEEKEGIPFYQGKSDFGKINPIPRVWCSNPIKIAEKDDILISVRAPIGDTNIATEKCCIGRGLASIRPLNENINKKYLYYLLNSKYKELNKFGTGSTFKAITKENLCNLKCAEIPDIKEQIEVVKKLDNVSQIIEIKKKQLEKLSIIIKSQFVEMFEEKEFPKIAIKDFADVRAGGTPDRKNKTYWENGNIPWIKTGEVKENLIVESEEYITELGLENSSAVLFDVGTILVAMYGQGVTRGRCAKLGIKATTNQACAGINIYDNKVINDYLFYYLQIKYEELRNLGLGGVQPNLNSKMIKEFEVILPPIELQNDFVKKIKLIDKQKFEIQKSLEEMQKLQESLMNKYFG